MIFIGQSTEKMDGHMFIYDQINREIMLTVILWINEIFSFCFLNERYRIKQLFSLSTFKI